MIKNDEIEILEDRKFINIEHRSKKSQIEKVVQGVIGNIFMFYFYFYYYYLLLYICV